LRNNRWIVILLVVLILLGCNGGESNNSNGNNPPRANAGTDQSVSAGVQVALNGSTSSDPDGNPLTYSWSLTAKPAESFATIASATSVTAYLTPDLPGSYAVQLIVNDGTVDSVADNMVVSARVNNSLKINPPYSSVAYEDRDGDGVDDKKWTRTYTYNSDGNPATSRIASRTIWRGHIFIL